MARPLRPGPSSRGPFAGPPAPGPLAFTKFPYVGNSKEPQLGDPKTMAGYAVIFAVALASGSVDDSRLSFGSQQAQLYDQSSTRSVFAPSAVPPAPLRALPIFAFAPGQIDERIQPAIYTPSLAEGGVDDSRLSFGSQQGNLYDQGVTRQIWASVVAALAPAPLRAIYAAPQLIDLTQQGQIWETPPPVQGTVPSAILIGQQGYVDAPSFVLAPTFAAQGRVPPAIFQPGQVDLTQQGWIRGTPPPRQGAVPPMAVQGQQLYVDAPSSVRGPTPGRQGPVPARTIQPQQSYVDVWARITAPNPAAQGRVPPTTVIGQQSYTDAPSAVRAPTPASQGPVPALAQASQSDPSQLPALIWQSATATVVIPNPVAPFWCVPGQDENRQSSFIWASLVAGQRPPVFSPVRAVQQFDTSQIAAQLWRSTRASGAVPRQNFGVPQIFEHDQSYTRVVWSPVATSQPLLPHMLWATPQFVDLQPVRVTPAVFTPLARPASFLAAAPQADPSINYSQVWVLRSFTTAGGQPFRAWVGIGRASSSTGEAGNVG